MLRRSRAPGSLATQISVSTLGLVALAVLLASILALAGVYNLARQETAVRMESFRDILHDDLTTRFVVADLVVESAAAQASGAESEDEAREGLYRLAGANTGYFDVMLLADGAGTVVSAWPPSAAPESIAGEPYFDARGDSARVLTWAPSASAEGPGRVWITEALAEESAGVVAARLRIGFVGLLVDEIASAESHRGALVLTGDGEVVEAGTGGPDIDLTEAQWEPSDEDPTQGRLMVEHADYGVMEGFYADVGATLGLNWRVIVYEPGSVALDRTKDALLPASLTILVAAVAAMWVAFLFGRRLAKPLRLLEDRAREVATGAYIEPIEVEREDEVGRLASAFNAMAARLNALQDLSQLLTSASELDQVLDSILSAMEHILGTGRAAVLLLDEGGMQLELVKASGARMRNPEVAVPVAGTSWVAQAFRTGRSVSFVMSPDDAPNDPVAALFATDAASTGLAVPLAIGHLPFGVVMVVGTGRRRFTDAETEMARAFSAQAAIAVQNSRLFEEEHLSRTEAEALRDMAELLAGPKGLESTLDQVGEIAAGLLQMGRSYIAMPERDRRGLEVGPPADPETDRRYLELWKGVAATRPDRRQEEPLPVEDVKHDPLYSDIARERGVESIMMIPIVQGDTHRGVLVLEGSDAGRAFSARDIAAAYATGKTISVAVETNFLFSQARRRAENLEMIFRISQAVSLSLQSTVVLNRVMDVVQKMFPATGIALMQFDSKRHVLTTAMVRGVEDKRVLLVEVASGEDVPGAVFESQRPTVIDDLELEETPMSGLLREQGFRSWLCVPLLARGRSIGVLSAYGVEPRAFGGEEAELVATFAAQAALALDTAALFEKEHTIASVLQSSIVPDVLPSIPWLETASIYQPAGSESEIGGDYYDMFLAPDGRLVLAIGDVCGKGVKAATKTSVIKYTLRGLVAAGLGPATAMRELNVVVAETGDIADIVTMWIGYLDPETGRLVYANAGHPPAYLRLPDGTVRDLAPTGPLLGALLDAEFKRKVVTVHPDAVLSLYTDGVTEARGQEGLFGETRLTEVVSQGGSAREVVDHVVTAVRSFTDGVLRDDVAMLVVRFRPDEGA